MTHRIKVHAEPAILRGLVVVNARASSYDRWFCGGDVGDRKVEVELLRVCAARPRGLDPVVDPLEGKRRTSFGVIGAHPATGWHKGSEVRVGTLFHFPAEDVCVEATERQRVGAVEDGEIELRLGLNRTAHARTVATAADGWQGLHFAVAHAADRSAFGNRLGSGPGYFRSAAHCSTSGTVRRGVAHGTAGTRVTVDPRVRRPYFSRTPNRSDRSIGRPAGRGFLS
jgi:hypothetical protein